MPRNLAQRLDWTLLITVVLLTTIGCLMIYSATRAEQGARKLRLQIIWACLGLLVFFLLMITDYNRLLNLAVPFMGLCIFLLLVVLLTGHFVKGAQRWIPIGPLHVQPSELFKLAAILFLSGFLASREEEIQSPGPVLGSLAYIGLPTLLILAQPDLGTPVLLFLVWLAMLFVAGARLSHLAAIVLAFLLLFAAAWGLNIIRPHQKERLTAFMNPEVDPHGSGWQQRQSLIAIGAGHLTGQGLFKGTQSRLRFVPDQETDFIFTVIGEETGFLGSVAVLSLFGLLLWRTLRIATAAKDTAGRLMAAGIAAMFLVHIFVNVGMTLGLMPVKGMPLPFVSYGGSNMIAMMAAVGLLQSIYVHRQKITF